MTHSAAQSQHDPGGHRSDDALGRRRRRRRHRALAVTAPRGVPYISTRAEALIGGAVALEMLAEAAPAPDAAILAAFGDPGLLGARELFDFPVVGVSEAAMLTACMLGGRFLIVSFTSAMLGWYRDCVAMHGLDGALRRRRRARSAVRRAGRGAGSARRRADRIRARARRARATPPASSSAARRWRASPRGRAKRLTGRCRSRRRGGEARRGAGGAAADEGEGRQFRAAGGEGVHRSVRCAGQAI